jgi:tripartite-type tricarboxylate transporter receptor subunit TctC
VIRLRVTQPILTNRKRTGPSQEKLKTYGMSPAPGTPEQFSALLQSESTRYAKVVREAGINGD